MTYQSDPPVAYSVPPSTLLTFYLPMVHPNRPNNLVPNIRFQVFMILIENFPKHSKNIKEISKWFSNRKMWEFPQKNSFMFEICMPLNSLQFGFLSLNSLQFGYLSCIPFLEFFYFCDSNNSFCSKKSWTICSKKVIPEPKRFILIRSNNFSTKRNGFFLCG